jgi:hypothetical protein
MMRSRLSALLLLLWSGGLLTVVVGCSRPAIVAPVEIARAEAPPVVVRAVAPAEAPGPAREKPATEPQGFRFPDDPGGALLAKVLSPGEAAPPSAARTTGPRPLPPPDLEPLPLSLPASRPPLVPHLPVQKGQSLPPRLILEDTLGGPRRDPALPSGPTLTAGERTRIPSVDVNKPIPLPILAQPVTDRAPLDDATGEASTAAALSAPMPRRTTPAPFLRLMLPDPYEHRRPVDMGPPAEQNTPVAARPKTPTR